jgi:methylated-DNA-[protein]-cysteine S-methyltransferase
MEVQSQVLTEMGTLFLKATDKGLTGLSWVKDPELKVSTKGNEHTQLAEKELLAFTKGKLKKFSCKFDFGAMKATDFQIKVWKKLIQIPFGKLKSYQDIAVALGDKNLVRAIGSANGKNRVPIIIPCHRVINKSGALGGYSGGLDKKRKLLHLEGVTLFN